MILTNGFRDPWDQPEQMLSRVSPYTDWKFALELAPDVRERARLSELLSVEREAQGGWPDTASPSDRIDALVGEYRSTGEALARYHRIFTAAVDLSKVPPPTDIPPPRMFVAATAWYLVHEAEWPPRAKFTGGDLPRIQDVEEVWSSHENLISASMYLTRWG